MNILLVDDELFALKIFETYSEKMDKIENLYSFMSPIAAINFISKNKIDIAFLDINLPEISGVELANKIKEIYPNVLIVFVTGYCDDRLIEIEAFDFLYKPYDFNTLEKIINKAYIKNTPLL